MPKKRPVLNPPSPVVERSPDLNSPSPVVKRSPDLNPPSPVVKRSPDLNPPFPMVRRSPGSSRNLQTATLRYVRSKDDVRAVHSAYLLQSPLPSEMNASESSKIRLQVTSTPSDIEGVDDSIKQHSSLSSAIAVAYGSPSPACSQVIQLSEMSSSRALSSSEHGSKRMIQSSSSTTGSESTQGSLPSTPDSRDKLPLSGAPINQLRP